MQPCRNSRLPWADNFARMSSVNRIFPILTCSTALLCLTGCLSQHMEKISGRVEKMYADIKGWEELPLRTITWQQARAMMQRNNDELRQAQNAIDDAERNSLSIYTDMIPGVSYYGYLTSSLDRLSETVTGEKELQSNINVNFSLPNLTQVPYRVYSNKVTTFAAMKAMEGKQRELVSRLYQTVRMRSIRKKQERLEEKNLDELAALKAANEKKDTESEHWKNMATLLGDSSARWEVLPVSLPSIRWKDYVHKLDKLDPLVVCNYAMQLEQARMAQYGIALQYAPTINTSLYSPSLFTSSGGTYSGTFLSGEDTKLNLSISYALDTDLQTWHSYQRSKEQYEQACRTVSASLRDHKAKVDKLKRSVAEYENWRSVMNKRIAFTEKMTASNADQYIEKQQSLLAMRREILTQEATAVESEAALILEYGLPGEKPSSLKP